MTSRHPNVTSNNGATEKRNKELAGQLIGTGIVSTSHAGRYHTLRNTKSNERPYKGTKLFFMFILRSRFSLRDDKQTTIKEDLYEAFTLLP